MILFSRITFKNFLSVGDRPVSINLNETKTTLIHGVNGAGKSTVLDSICYALFGKPFRRVNLPQLVNTQNNKGLLTEVEFTIGNTDYMVVRGMKPKVFKIFKNGKELDSKAADRDNQKYLENVVLKMSHKTFCQVVILGSSNFVPFMQLSGAGRRECVEDFLDISVFSTMSVIAKERLRGLKDRFSEVRGDISNLEYRRDLQQERVDELKNKNQLNIHTIKTLIQEKRDLIVKEQEIISSLQKQDEELMTKVSSILRSSPKKMSDEYSKVVYKLDNKIDRLQKEINFYRDNDNCPTCSQVLSDSIKEQNIKTNLTESTKLEDVRDQAKDKLMTFDSVLRQVQDYETQIQDIQNKVFQSQTKVESFQREIVEQEDRMTNEQDYVSIINKEEGKLEIIDEDIKKLISKKEEMINEIAEHEVVVSLLKDSGIKTLIVRKYLPVMNKFIRKYLSDLDYPIFFKLDEEFNESISSPLYQNYSYSSFSEGQKARIDLALMFTWREIGKLKNSVSTNILILDEVFSSSLDEVGKENLLSLLRYGLDDSQRIIVVDHTLSQNFKEKFDTSIEVKKVKGFSTYLIPQKTFGEP